ncbi:biogenesis of lysosome-related organelles complex 1 subunit 1 isoform X2 [Nymphaea colorata]|uniref:biogenesis of lysosome-related organelles complex 1 subunit 1 isoform X2 n=1 Tax=Nymphaea colorata TaxID=210225 RepID=UPI00129E1A2E|nr:biogenesis of lysosome-related organelles complex 1 subunit 1 isoform X2 [Nymphaea colorata]
MQQQMEMEERRGSLEVYLLRLVEDYHQNTNLIRENADVLCFPEKSTKAALRAAQRVSELLLDTVNGGVQVSFTNEKLIEAEIRALAVTVARYLKQTNQWLATSHSMNSILKIGDFENWMKTMDYECKSINAALKKICNS